MQTINLIEQEMPYEINEEMKVLRTNLQFCGTDKKVILFTSAFSGEGKSTVALDLARSLVELGRRVMLIDTDMRNSGLTRMVEGEAPQYGLSHYLSKQCEMKDVIYATNTPKLSVRERRFPI